MRGRLGMRVVVAGMVLIAGLAGCTSKSVDKSGPNGGPAITPGSPATSSAPAGGSVNGGPQAAAATIHLFAFAPSSLDIKVGTEVTWTNQDDTDHTVTSVGSSEFDSGHVAKSQVFKHIFATAGSFSYNCTIHPAMKGTVKVTA